MSPLALLVFPGYFALWSVVFLFAVGAMKTIANRFPARRRLSSVGFGLVGFAHPFVVYTSMSLIGFPDGTITDFELPMQSIFPFFALVSCTLGCAFLVHARRNQFERYLHHFEAALALLYGVMILIELLRSQILDHGIGG